jgi:hypothetical protein
MKKPTGLAIFNRSEKADEACCVDDWSTEWSSAFVVVKLIVTVP